MALPLSRRAMAFAFGGSAMDGITRSARRVMALATATFLTLALGYALNTTTRSEFGQIIYCICFSGIYPGPIFDDTCFFHHCGQPPHVRLFRPHARAVLPPVILCVSPDDPNAVVPCEQLFRPAPASHPGSGGS
jgi:hypothetical protein